MRSFSLKKPAGLAFLGALALLAAAAAEQDPPPAAPTVSVDRSRLEVVEDLSESLANELLELSLATRDRDLDRMAAFFPETLAGGPLPTEAGPVRRQLRWIGTRSWAAPAGASGPRERRRGEAVGEWARLLEHFSEVEDARFKVKGAQFDETARGVEGAEQPTAAPGATGDARVAFYVIGRDREGRREWLRGVAQVAVRKPEKGVWQFTSFETTEMTSMVALSDLFSEVALPAGVAATLPPYGAPGNGGFVWRGAAAGDLDGDGWLDLFVTSVGRNFLSSTPATAASATPARRRGSLCSPAGQPRSCWTSTTTATPTSSSPRSASRCCSRTVWSRRVGSTSRTSRSRRGWGSPRSASARWPPTSTATPGPTST